jgi:hypothetical protein
VVVAVNNESPRHPETMLRLINEAIGTIQISVIRFPDLKQSETDNRPYLNFDFNNFFNSFQASTQATESSQ